ncbi:zinc finger protein 782 isoform X2 [Leptidea sinapis]|nr:zinc finger protein 782 isoform X2 [Leptidea sinapis]
MHLPKPLQLECDHCGKITSSKATMLKHLEIHGDKKYVCMVCGYKTYTVEVMRRHTYTHIDNKPNKCDICDKSYIQRGQLLKHLKKHEGFFCTYCKEQFNTKPAVIVHEQLHHRDPEGKLKCPYEDCESIIEFKDEKTLEKHVKRHLTVTQFRCDVCGKRLQSEATMQRHVSTHTLDRPRRCMYCAQARAYVRGEHLLRHVRKSHGEMFKQRLMHVRQVLGTQSSTDRVSKSELEAILNMLDAESDRILEDLGTGVMYAGLQEERSEEYVVEVPLKTEPSPLMSEPVLVEKLKLLLNNLIEIKLLEEFGWPDASIDEILEKVIEKCGARPADRKWSRVQRLRENTKHLFLYVIEDSTVDKMLETHTIDEVIQHILEKVSDD